MTLVLTAWDVQHGSATHVRLPSGGHIVIDLGVGDITRREASFSPLQYLINNGGRVDEIVVTHPHRDHLDDIWRVDAANPMVFSRPRHLSQAEIRAGNRPEDSEVLDKYLDLDARYSSPVSTWANPELSQVNGGVDVASFCATGSSRNNLNNHSIVTFMHYLNTTFCIPGDNEAPSWRDLLLVPGFRLWLKQTNVLIAPHHGREAGYCSDIFDYCAPRLVVVSDGPESDTSAVAKYRNHATGWPVTSRSRRSTETRYVLTTRCDGTIMATVYADAAQTYLSISIE